MIQTTVTDAKSRLSELLNRVALGETVLILHRGRPIARLVPAAPADEDSHGRLAQLERDGLVRRGDMAPDAALLDGDAPRVPAAASLLQAVLDERSDAP